MHHRSLFMFLVGITIALQLSGCSKNGTQPPRSAAKTPQGLIDVVHDAVTVYASGARTYKAPPGITIAVKDVVRNEGGRKVPYTEVSGLKQKQESLSIITFRVPSSWLSTEKENLAGLEAEKETLKGCAEKLQGRATGSAAGTPPDPSCRIMAIGAHGREGIAVVDDRVSHIEMLTYASR